jgi:hypothetical protein
MAQVLMRPSIPACADFSKFSFSWRLGEEGAARVPVDFFGYPAKIPSTRARTIGRRGRLVDDFDFEISVPSDRLLATNASSHQGALTGFPS